MNLNFFKDKSVFVTGHTGFKGAWLCHILKKAGARVTGYALTPEEGGVFDAARVSDGMDSVIGDIRNLSTLDSVFGKAQPEIVLHLVAQPLVREAYRRPAYTFETNVMGTVNLLECVRESASVRSVVIVTTDKVYKNHEWVYGYREIDALGGVDPYSASKSCVEMVTDAYVKSFLNSKNIPLSAARAGNVIGGGDISVDRIIPDCIRASVHGTPIAVRNPYSVRPYQHVLEPLFAYLMIAEAQCQDAAIASCYNIGPGEDGCVNTGTLVTAFCHEWGGGMDWENISESSAPPESHWLRLDCAKIRAVLGWKPIWDIRTAIAKTVAWEKLRLAGGDVRPLMDSQLDEYGEAWNT